MLNWSLNSCGFRKPLCVKKQPLKFWYVLVQLEGCAQDTQILPPYKTPWFCRSVSDIIRIAGVLPLHTPSIRNPKQTKNNTHTHSQGREDWCSFLGNPPHYIDFSKVPGLRLHFFVEVSGLKPDDTWILSTLPKIVVAFFPFLQELEDEQQKEHALTEVRGSIFVVFFVKTPWRQTTRPRNKPESCCFFFFPPSNETKKGMVLVAKNSSRKVIFLKIVKCSLLEGLNSKQSELAPRFFGLKSYLPLLPK